jgi:hypothetical protein
MLKKKGGIQMLNPPETEGISTESAGSTFSMDYGRRPLKAYPVTDGELSQVFGLGNWATACFSIGAGLFGFALDVSKDLAMSHELSEKSKIFWETVNTGSYISFGVFFIIGISLLIMRHGKVKEIKKETIFPGS